MVHGSDSAARWSWLEFCFVRHWGCDLGCSLGASVPSATEGGSIEPAFQGSSERQTSHVWVMLILCGPSPLNPQSGSDPALLGSSGCGAVTSSAVRLADPVRWDEAGDNVSHAGRSLLFPSTSSARRAVRGTGSCAGVQSLSLPRAAATPSSR